MKARTRLKIAMFVPLLMIIVISLVVLYTSWQTEHVSVQRQAIPQMVRAMYDLQGLHHEFLHGDSSSVRDQWQDSLETLASRLVASPRFYQDDAILLDKASAALATMHNLYREFVEANRRWRAGDYPGFEAYQQQVDLQLEQLDRILVRNVFALRASSENYVAEMHRTANRITGGVVILAILLAGYFGVRSSRGISAIFGNITTTAEKITTTADQQERISLQQAGATTQLAATIHNLETSMNQIREQAETAATSSDVANRQAVQGDEMVQRVLQAMQALHQEVTTLGHRILAISERMGEVEGISKVVRDLAKQTHLLALNASVEAARAGEEGEGFGVIAREVRELADHSKQSVEQISQVISNLQEDIQQTLMVNDKGLKTTEDMAALVEETGGVFREFLNLVTRISDNLEQVVFNVSEQAGAVRQIASTTTELTQSAQEIASVASRTREGIVQLREAAQSAHDAV